MSTSHLIERNSSPAKRPPSDPPITTACFAALAWFLIGAPCPIRPLGFRAWRHGALEGCCHQEVDGTAGVSSTTELPYASRQLRLVPQAAISLHARGPDPQALGSVDNDDGLCPKRAYLQAPWIIGKRAFETDYYGDP